MNIIASDTLDTLILNKNQIRMIPDRAFKHLVGLNSLEIENNEISLIQNDAFSQVEGKHRHQDDKRFVWFTKLAGR